MRRLLTILLLLLNVVLLHAQKQPYVVLDSLLTNYTQAIQTQDIDSKKAECDYLISSVQDKEMRVHIATTLFKHYRNAPVMGDEEIAIYIFDKWFADGKMKMEGEFTQMDAEMFANINRNSLIGMEAPSLKLRKPCGGKAIVPRKGETTVLWFYDTSCAKCKLESKVLPGVLDQSVDFPIRFCAVYTGQNKKDWKSFRKSFRLSNKNITLSHFWDPEVDSDYIRMYGVASTPKMFLITDSGIIAGRRLEVESLPNILPIAKELSNLLDK